MPAPDLRDRYGPWAVVTGASSGIGRAFAEYLAGAGIHVALASRSAERLGEIGESLTAAHGVDHRVVQVDLTDPAAPRALIAATDDLDVGLLVSNAGEAVAKDFLDHELDELQRQVVLNATSHLELTHHFGRRLVARGRGGIVLTAASGAFHGMPHLANAAAAKGYVHHLGEALHHEFAPAGVDVTVFMPGNVDTPLVEHLGLDPASLPLMSPEVAVTQAMRALRSGTATMVPGRTIRWSMRLMPRRLSIRVNGALMRRAAATVASRAPQAPTAADPAA